MLLFFLPYLLPFFYAENFVNSVKLLSSKRRSSQSGPSKRTVFLFTLSVDQRLVKGNCRLVGASVVLVSDFRR